MINHSHNSSYFDASTHVLKRTPKLILGVDIGTSGVRACLVSVDRTDGANSETIIAEYSVNLPAPHKCSQSGASVQSPHIWTSAFIALFTQLAQKPQFGMVEHIVADATSSTVLLCDADGMALTDALMYDDQQAKEAAQKVHILLSRLDEKVLNTAATGASSTLAKVHYLLESLQIKQKNNQPIKQPIQICHQIDWFNAWLTGQLGITDENNALKLGYDSILGEWPSWVKDCLQPESKVRKSSLKAGVLVLPPSLTIGLPKVLKPGSVLAQVSSSFAKQWRLSPQVTVHAGTTDSIAGFLASGAQYVGDAVSSLGSTIAVKVISEKPIFNSEYGIYSHRLGESWLVGGASNAGGAVLLNHFSLDEIKGHSAWLMQPVNRPFWQKKPNPDYYPLIKSGDRFPISNSSLEPRIPPLPDSKSENRELEESLFLVGLVQGLANIEWLGYQQLEALGSPPIKRLFSVGGGTKNPIWQQLRREYLQQPFNQPDSLDAAFGVTRLVSTFYKY